MAADLYIDIETFSEIDIKKSGAYRYIEHDSFEILLVAYAFDNEQVRIIDFFMANEPLPKELKDAFKNPLIKKHAHNANFERLAFQKYGFDIPIEQWHCSAIKSAYCGYPLGLSEVSKAMQLEERGKLATGKALIKLFCSPCAPKKSNGFETRNYPSKNWAKWEEFKKYCINDVVAEREVVSRLSKYTIPDSERINYIIDQQINDRGILIDTEIAENAVRFDTLFSGGITTKVQEITGLGNPNSPAQLKKWLSESMGVEVTSLTKESVTDLMNETDDEDILNVLSGRTLMAKTSIKKYEAMLNCVCEDGRAHGLFQLYGANRTGRFAGRLIQLQNLPQNHMGDLELARGVLKSGDYELMNMLYDNTPTVLSELIRTAFIAKPHHTFCVADFSAIEARVLAWLAAEKWRLDVFKSHGKIYEASAAMMFGVPIESVTKGSDLRQKGKVAELALGYNGSVGALTKMGGEKMGLPIDEMAAIVQRWRLANPMIVKLWKDIENAAKYAIKTHKTVKVKSLIFACDENAFTITLPSGRKLFYVNPNFGVNQFGSESIKFMGTDQTTKQWGWIDTYGGKLTENVVQAIARDILTDSMQRINTAKMGIVMHVHDEVACEVEIEKAGAKLEEMCTIMGQEIRWAVGLPLTANGYITPFYKKD